MNSQIFFTVIILLFSFTAWSQNASKIRAKAEEAVQQEDYESAAKYYDQLLSDFTSTGYLDFYYGALSVNLQEKPDPNKAMKWLENSAEKGLGKEDEELQAILKQSEFETLYNHQDWNKFVGIMVKNITDKKEESERWMKELLEDDSSKFSLKFYTSENEQLPYLLYIPDSVDLNNNPTLITFLHGGRGTETFYDYYSMPELKTDEPIFKVAKELKAIVIYPIQKSSYGWYNKKEPLEDLQNIVRNEIEELGLEKGKKIAGGMSNGGKATFWLAQKDEAIFDAFFTVSAEPKLEFGEIDFEKINVPFISLQATNDEVFLYKNVKEIYDRQQNKTKSWKMSAKKFEGGHGFIYNPDNYDKFKNLVKQSIISSQK